MSSNTNLLDLQSNLPRSLRTLLERIRSWGATEVEPHIARHWEDGTMPSHLIPSFQKCLPDLLGYPIPTEYGGQGYDLMTACQISITLAKIDASFTTTILVQYGLAAESILICGNESQKRRLLPGLCSLNQMGCFCLTEPQSGSDASDLRTTAVPDGNGGYHITGQKRWIGNGETADVFVVWARNMGLPDHPVMGFIVERTHQTKPDAIRTSKIEGKISMRMLQNANVDFHNCYCPPENVMDGHVGFGQSVGRVLEASRVSVGWIPVGICMGALEKTIDYVKKRDAFGAPISSYQLTQEKLVRATSTVASMYLLVERVTQEYQLGQCDIAAISMTKAHTTLAGRTVVALCREILGGNGIVLDFGVASKFCDIESTFTYEGTYDICCLVAGRALTGIAAIKSPAGSKMMEKKRNTNENGISQRKPQSRL
jgi:alkylation response protein AidB-like acyl-CoA dehydrogenase